MQLINGIQNSFIADRVDCSVLDFSTVSSFINTLYSLTGVFRIWGLLYKVGPVVEYKSTDYDAIIVIRDGEILCCKFYSLPASILNISIPKPYKCKVILNGFVIEK